jgi:hypothetical protein
LITNSKLIKYNIIFNIYILIHGCQLVTTLLQLQEACSLTSHCTFLFSLVCEAIGTAATPGLLCQPRVRVKMIVEKQMECRLWHGKPKFSEKTFPSATSVHHKIPHDQDPGLNPGHLCVKPATNRLSYGAAFALHFLSCKGDGAEQNLSKVHGSWLGWPSGDVLTSCQRDVWNILPCQLFSNIFINILLCIPRYLVYSNCCVNIIYCPHCSSWEHCMSTYPTQQYWTWWAMLW